MRSTASQSAAVRRCGQCRFRYFARLTCRGRHDDDGGLTATVGQAAIQAAAATKAETDEATAAAETRATHFRAAARLPSKSRYGLRPLHGCPDERRQVGRTVPRLQRQRADVKTRDYRDPTEPIFEGAVLSGGRYLAQPAAKMTEGAQLPRRRLSKSAARGRLT